MTGRPTGTHNNVLPVPTDTRSFTKSLTYLTLGDGDFSYSLDLARYLRRSMEEDDDAENDTVTELIATGIDTVPDLKLKYKDTPYILQQLQAVAKGHSKVSVKVRHGVNAIVLSRGENAEPDGGDWIGNGADHVMFHHPHLGTEDASLHSKFLAHLFHSVTNHWMKKDGGLLHLTLVEGQHERWHCSEAAHRHGMVLLNQSTFVAPPSQKSTYHYRRHQTGKSFATRRPNGTSITFTYGRDNNCQSTICLPWQTQGKFNTQKTVEKDENENGSTVVLSCPFCYKEFFEERSRKCHIRDKHRDEHDDATKRRNLAPPPIIYQCTECNNDKGNPRLFHSKEALQAHVIAKHSGIHTYVPSDWSLAKRSAKQRETQDESNHDDKETFPLDACSICGFDLPHGRTTAEHLQDFIPRSAEVDIVLAFSCSFCGKSFQEERATLQHENFCSER